MSVEAPARTASLALTAAAASGALVALQQRINGELKTALGDTLLTALVSFGTGLLAVVVVVLSRPSARAAVRLVRDVAWVQRLGGLGGATLVAVGAAAAPEIGVALLTVGLVAGQTTGGLLVDRVGWGPGGSHRLTAPRVLGAALCLVAVGISVLGDGARAASPLLLVLVVVAGLLISVQQALNGQVRRVTGDAGVATLVNFVGGTLALGLGVLVHAASTGLNVGAWPGPGQWYLYLGGPMGATFVAIAAVVVRRLGVFRLGLAVIAGQLVGALLLDVLAPVHGRGVELLTVVGVALTLVAVYVAGSGGRR
ncbi:MAG: DMT family transporter [Frankiales bacterium]|nr:DMT family transporter [Frankiales bacterium]